MPLISIAAMFPLAAADSDAAAAGSIISILAFAAIFITVVWIVFPFIVHYHFEALKKLQRETNSYLKRMTEEVAAANTPKRPQPAVKSPPSPTAPAPSKGEDVYRI